MFGVFRSRESILDYVDTNQGIPEFLLLPEDRAVVDALVQDGTLTTKRESRRHSSHGWWYVRYVRKGG